MPRYTYNCEECGETFNAVHSMSTLLEKKDECPDECILNKLPSNLTILKNNVKYKNKQKVGSVVKSSIEEMKQDIKQEKEDLTNQTYE